MAKLQVDARFSEPAYPQCRAIQQEVQNSWCMYSWATFQNFVKLDENSQSIF